MKPPRIHNKLGAVSSQSQGEVKESPAIMRLHLAPVLSQPTLPPKLYRA